MRIKIPVNRAECFRKRIEYQDEFLEVDIAPDELTDEERNLIAQHLGDDMTFKPLKSFKICPPTRERFLEWVKMFLAAIPKGSDD